MTGETTLFFREVLNRRSEPARVPGLRLDDGECASRREFYELPASSPAKEFQRVAFTPKEGIAAAC